MSARCETIGRYVLPIFRALVAKQLISVHHFTQNDAAEKLKTTQAAISQYVNSKRAIKNTEQIAQILPKIQKMANDTANRLAKNEVNWSEVTQNFCEQCSNLFEEPNQTGDHYSI